MKTIQTILLRKNHSLGLDTQNQTFMVSVHCKWEVFYVTLTFKEEQLNKLKLHTCWALSDVYGHQQMFGSPFVCLSPQAYFKDLANRRLLLHGR